MNLQKCNRGSGSGALMGCWSSYLTVVAFEASPTQYSCFIALRTSVADVIFSEEIRDIIEDMLFARL